MVAPFRKILEPLLIKFNVGTFTLEPFCRKIIEAKLAVRLVAAVSLLPLNIPRPPALVSVVTAGRIRLPDAQISK